MAKKPIPKTDTLAPTPEAKFDRGKAMEELAILIKLVYRGEVKALAYAVRYANGEDDFHIHGKKLGKVLDKLHNHELVKSTEGTRAV